jgi:cytochrome c oxidase assembly factor CtaG
VTGQSPWGFEPHVASWVITAGLACAYVAAVRRTKSSVSGRQIVYAVLACLLILVALTWPLADMATRWSLTALVCQRLLLLLAIPPVVILSLPTSVSARLTRPRMVDALVRRLARPAVAVALVTVIAVGTLTTGAVELQASSTWARAGLDLVLIFGGFVLWAPVLTELPGTDRPSALGRTGYLIVQSIVPSFLAIVWIFARHPLYPHYASGPHLFGVAPLLDQQMAGFLAKFATIGVLWTVAFVTLNRAQHTVASGGDPDPLLWSDVERHLERAERRERRRSAWLPQVPIDPGTETDRGADHERPRPADDP